MRVFVSTLCLACGKNVQSWAVQSPRVGMWVVFLHGPRRSSLRFCVQMEGLMLWITPDGVSLLSYRYSNNYVKSYLQITFSSYHNNLCHSLLCRAWLLPSWIHICWIYCFLLHVLLFVGRNKWRCWWMVGHISASSSGRTECIDVNEIVPSLYLLSLQMEN